MDHDLRFAPVIALNRMAYLARKMWPEPFAYVHDPSFDVLTLGRMASLGMARLGLDPAFLVWATSLALWTRSPIAYWFDPDVWTCLAPTPIDDVPTDAMRVPHEAQLIIPPSPVSIGSEPPCTLIRAALVTVGDFRPNEVKLVLVPDDIVRQLGDRVVQRTERRGRMPGAPFSFSVPLGSYVPLRGACLGEALEATVTEQVRAYRLLVGSDPDVSRITHEVRTIAESFFNALLLIANPQCDMMDATHPSMLRSDGSHATAASQPSGAPCATGQGAPQDALPHHARMRVVGVAWGAALRVGGTDDASDAAHPSRRSARQSPRPHVRRGHWRWQAHGPQWSERTLRWIHPSLINVQAQDSAPVATLRTVRQRRSRR